MKLKDESEQSTKIINMISFVWKLKFISTYNEPKAEPILNTNFKISPLPVFQPPKQNPEMIEAERRYKAILEESEREKQRNRSTGLAGLLGLE